MKKLLLLLFLTGIAQAQYSNWKDKTAEQLSGITSGTTNIASKNYWTSNAYAQLKVLFDMMDGLTVADDTTALKLLPSDISLTQAGLLQSSSSDSTGGGLFVLRSLVWAKANLGTYTANKVTIFSSSSSSYRWVRKDYSENKILNIGWLATGDSTTNVKTAFTTIATLLNDQGGGRILIPKGKTSTYNIGANATAISITKPVEIIGDDIVIEGSDSTASMFDFTNSVKISGVSFRYIKYPISIKNIGDDTQGTKGAVASFERIKFIDCYKGIDGVHSYGSPETGTKAIELLSVESCIFDSTVMPVVVGENPIKQIKITNTVFKNVIVNADDSRTDFNGNVVDKAFHTAISVDTNPINSTLIVDNCDIDSVISYGPPSAQAGKYNHLIYAILTYNRTMVKITNTNFNYIALDINASDPDSTVGAAHAMYLIGSQNHQTIVDNCDFYNAGWGSSAAPGGAVVYKGHLDNSPIIISNCSFYTTDAYRDSLNVWAGETGNCVGIYSFGGTNFSRSVIGPNNTFYADTADVFFSFISSKHDAGDELTVKGNIFKEGAQFIFYGLKGSKTMKFLNNEIYNDDKGLFYGTDVPQYLDVSNNIWWREQSGSYPVWINKIPNVFTFSNNKLMQYTSTLPVATAFFPVFVYMNDFNGYYDKDSVSAWTDQASSLVVSQDTQGEYPYNNSSYLTFDTDDHLTLSSPAAGTDIGTNDVTFSLKFKKTDASTLGYILSKYLNTNNQYNVYVNANDITANGVVSANSAFSVITNSDYISDNTITRVIISIDRDVGATMLINGSSATLSTNTYDNNAYTLDLTTDFSVAKRGIGDAGFFTGDIYWAQMDTVAFTSAQMIDMDNYLAGKSPGFQPVTDNTAYSWQASLGKTTLIDTAGISFSLDNNISNGIATGIIYLLAKIGNLSITNNTVYGDGAYNIFGSITDSIKQDFILTNNTFLYANSDPLAGKESFVSGNLYLSGNVGIKGKNSGTATISSGTSSVTVSHGLAVTPLITEIFATPTSSLDSLSFYVDTAGVDIATQFKIHTSQNTGADEIFNWFINTEDR